MQILITIVVNALAIWVADALIAGVTVGDNGSLPSKVLTLLVLGAIFAAVNALIKPIVKLFSLPFYVLTLGLFALVVNAFMLKIASWVANQLGVSFHVGDFFWSAIGAAIVVSLVSMALNLVLD